jgi:MFS family permease
LPPPIDAPGSLPVGRVLAVTTATQALSTLGALALAAVAPAAAATLGVSAALIGYQVGLVFFGAMLSASIAGGVVMRHGPVRASQIALAMVASGCALSAGGSMAALVAGAFLMGIGYGIPNPAASLLLSRVPSHRSMNLIFSIKQTGVPIGGVVSGLLVPPLTLAFGWQAALGICAVLIAILAVAIGHYRQAWDTGRVPHAPVMGSAIAALAMVWKYRAIRWLAGASFLYSGVQLCLTGFLATYLVTEIGLSLVVAGTVLSITHAAGAFGRLGWGWLADRLGSGGYALAINGAATMAGGLLVAAVAPSWPMWAIAAACAAFGAGAMGWNGVYIAAVARQAPAGGIGLATGGSLSVTYAGVISMSPIFATLHDRAGMSYAGIYALSALVALAGIACVLAARRAARR